MKKRWIYGMLVCGLLCTGCNQIAPSRETEEAVVEETAEATGETEELSPLQTYELRYSQGEFSAEDYRELAALYAEEGRVREQRDLLEQGYRLFDDAQSLELLQGIWVNLEEEEPEIMEAARLMQDNLELSDYRDEAVNLIAGGDWLQTMNPKLHEGKRNYFKEQDGKLKLIIQAGHEMNGTESIAVWLIEQEQVTFLQKQGQTIQVLTTGLQNDQYQGSFESWLLSAGTGDIYHEQGTFEAGRLTGDYTVGLHKGNEGSDAFSLWCNREGMEYTNYNGTFDGEGRTSLAQPETTAIAELVKNTGYDTAVIYAYNEAKDKCLYVGLSQEEASAYIFDVERLGWVGVPTVATYTVAAREAETENADEVAEDVENASGESVEEEQEETAAETVQARIFDGMVQVLVDGAWVNAGSVNELAKADPFHVYAEREPQSNTETEENVEGETPVEQPDRWAHTVGTIKKAETPKTTTNTSKPKSSDSTTKPAPTPAPEPTPAPSNPTPAPSNPAPAPTPAPAPEPEPTGGNDTDIEWTDDIL